MRPFATIEDLKEHWGSLPEEYASDAEQKLKEASIIIRALYPSVDAWVNSGRLNADTLQFITCDMVASAIRRIIEAQEGDNLQQQTFSAGPYSQTMSYRIREANLFLTKQHKQMLTGGRTHTGKAFMIVPRP